MKNLFLLLIAGTTIIGCKKNENKIHSNLPTVTIDNSVVDSDTMVVMSCNLRDTGTGTIIAFGVCWSSTNPEPSLSDNVQENISQFRGEFSAFIFPLIPGTTYYFRAYATNTNGTSYSQAIKLITTGTRPSTTLPVVTTNTVNWASFGNSVYVGGSVTLTGGAPVTERGICWDTFPNPTTSTHKITGGNGTGPFSMSLYTQPGKMYYVRAYAINSFGTAYGNEEHGIYSNAPTLPLVQTISIDSITSTTAICTSYATPNGFDPIYDHGVYWATHNNPSLVDNKLGSGGGYGYYAIKLTNLVPNTTYYVRAYAQNTYGIGVGYDLSFTTLP